VCGRDESVIAEERRTKECHVDRERERERHEDAGVVVGE
jgi:hypothetical protein